MNNKEFFIVCFIFFLCLVFSFMPDLIIAETSVECLINVPDDFTTIQGAINSAVADCTIVVAPGVYKENIHFHGKNLLLRSIDPSSDTVVSETVIDGQNLGTVVAFSGTETSECVLSGFSIMNGKAPLGGGILGNGCKATIQYNHIRNNRAIGTWPNGYGGGISSCDGAINYNIISENVAEYIGGGIVFSPGEISHNNIHHNTAVLSGGGIAYCDGTIRENTITDNITTEKQGTGGGISYCDGMIQDNDISRNKVKGENGQGGGIHGGYAVIQGNIIFNNSVEGYDGEGGGICGCPGMIRNNKISHNKVPNVSGSGGGICFSDGTIINNIIVSNSCYSSGAGIYSCDGMIINNTICQNMAKQYAGILGSYGLVVNCIVWNNTCTEGGSQVYLWHLPRYSCIQDWAGGGEGNISQNPGFTGVPEYYFTLKSDSPCIDAGYMYYLFDDYIADFFGNKRIAGLSVDMGAFEYGADKDSDGDILSDQEENIISCNPDNPDTDGDGLMDGVEVLRGTEPTTGGSPPGMIIPDDYDSIQKAIFLAYPHEEITIYPGIYGENLHLLGKNLVIKGSNPFDSSTVQNVILDGNGAFSTIMFKGNEDASCVIAGLTITNGYNNLGGGIKGNYSSMVTIQYNHITTNTASYGGGLYLCNGLIEHNLINGNQTTTSGGGIYWADGTIRYNIISHNLAGNGGGLANINGIVMNNIIHHNTAGLGGGNGGGISGGDADCYNNIIYENNASHGGGIEYFKGDIINNIICHNKAFSEGGGLSLCTGSIRNSIVWNNSASLGAQIYQSSVPGYCCIQDWTGGGVGNISENPLFADEDKHDFYLRYDSPCIDAGDPLGKYNDACLPPGRKTKTNDMGAFGGPYNCGWIILHYLDIIDHILGRSTLPSNLLDKADRNNDGVIDIADVECFIKSPDLPIFP